MRIHFVTGSLSRAAGGLFESVRRLAQATVGAKYEVEVFGVEDAHAPADLPAWHPLDAHLFRRYGPERFSFAPGLLRGLQSRAADVLMSHGLWRYTSVATHRWHAQTRRRYIVHPHGMLDDWALRNARWKKRLASFCYEAAHLRDAACIRALCQAEAEAIRKYGLSNPIAIIPNGVDLPEEAATGPQDKRMRTTGRKTLLFLGRIHPKKGLRNLLKAWKQVNAADWLLAIAGWDDGGHLVHLKQLCDELNLPWADDIRENVADQPHDHETSTSERGWKKGERRKEKGPPLFTPSGSDAPSLRGSSVLFLGPRFNTAKSACFRACDAFILPSFSEGVPMAALEAWSYGKPVLITEHCHLPEAFAAGAAIKISPEPHELARQLDELVRMSDASLADMGKRGRVLVKARFNWENIGAQMRSVCAWAAGGAPRPDCVLP